MNKKNLIIMIALASLAVLFFGGGLVATMVINSSQETAENSLPCQISMAIGVLFMGATVLYDVFLRTREVMKHD